MYNNVHYYICHHLNKRLYMKNNLSKTFSFTVKMSKILKSLELILYNIIFKVTIRIFPNIPHWSSLKQIKDNLKKKYMVNE